MIISLLPVFTMLHIIHNFSILIIIFIFPLHIFSQSQNNTNITAGSSVTATENSNPWLSPSGDFALGFQQLPNNTDLFILSIWFNRIPDRTIVWFERSSYPVPRGSTLQLEATRGLLLRDSRGRLLWNTGNFADQVAYGFLNDTGNFVLFSANTDMLWQSFRHASDTILPTQTIAIGEVLGSRMSESNFSQGKFSAQMDESGSFLFHTQNVPWNTFFDITYYSSQTSDVNNASNSGYQVLFSQNGALSVTRRNGLQNILTPQSNPPASDNYYRATLDPDGVFTQYYHPRSFSGNPGWTVAGSWPDNICAAINSVEGTGSCGYNSLCRLVNRRPVCKCPQGFKLHDPNNPYGDCLPTFNPHCVAGENNSVFTMLELSDTHWPMRDYESSQPSSEVNCSSSCLSDCLCSAVIYNSDHQKCWKKSYPLANGRVDNTVNAKAFLKLRNYDPVPSPPDPQTTTQLQPRREQKTLMLTGSVLLGSSAFINVLLTAAGCLGYFLIYKRKTPPLMNSVHITAGANLRCYTYKELLQATNGFKEELGRGSFGIVYKGEILDNSKTVIAVKKLDRISEDSEKEFRMEVNAIGQTHHKNLVRLHGFCAEGPNRLLVYEYMSNGTLADFLFGASKLSWSQRCLMALGVARGLTYLHEECITQIIHCDIKPQNILVDEHYNARIADFGLAKLLRMDQTQTLTNIRGTKGYVAPEWFRNKQITSKVDVYSFGVLLLEIISCRRNVDNAENLEDGENSILTDWAWDCFKEDQLESLVDDDTEALVDRSRLQRFVKVAIWCIQEDALLRPTMRKVSQMLEGIVGVAKPPCPSP